HALQALAGEPKTLRHLGLAREKERNFQEFAERIVIASLRNQGLAATQMGARREDAAVGLDHRVEPRERVIRPLQREQRAAAPEVRLRLQFELREVAAELRQRVETLFGTAELAEAEPRAEEAVGAMVVLGPALQELVERRERRLELAGAIERLAREIERLAAQRTLREA